MKNIIKNLIVSAVVLNITVMQSVPVAKGYTGDISEKDNEFEINENFYIDKNSTLYQAQSEFSLTADTDKIGHIFFNEDIVEFKIDALGASGEIEIKANVKDKENGGIILVETFIKKISDSSYYMVIDNAPFGIFDVEIEAVDKTTGESAVCTTYFSRVNGCENGKVNPKMGINSHYSWTYFPDTGNANAILAQKAGFSMNRESILWEGYEKEQGKFELTENRINWLNHNYNAGIKPVICLQQSNSLWTEENPPRSEEALGHFADYVHNVVKNTRNYTDKYEIWNEYNCVGGNFNPDGGTTQDYVNLLKYSYEAAKKANPDCTIWGGAVANVTMGDFGDLDMYGWIEEIFKYGGGKYMDVLTVHPYHVFSSPESGDIEGKYIKIKEILKKYGYGNMPIVFSEYGWTSGVSTRKSQAAYSLRSAAITYNDVESILWYVLNEKYSSNDKENKFGLVNSNDPETEHPYEAKPVYLALANMNRLISGAVRSEDLSEDEGIYDYIFTTPDSKEVRMLWSLSDTQYTFTDSSDKLILCDMYGNESEISSSDGEYTISLTSNPVYLKEVEEEATLTAKVIYQETGDKANVKIQFSKNILSDGTVDVVNDGTGESIKSGDIIKLDNAWIIPVEQITSADKFCVVLPDDIEAQAKRLYFKSDEAPKKDLIKSEVDFDNSGFVGEGVYAEVVDTGEYGHNKVLKLTNNEEQGGYLYWDSGLDSKTKKVILSFDLKIEESGTPLSGTEVIRVFSRSCNGVGENDGKYTSDYQDRQMVLNKSNEFYCRYNAKRYLRSGEWNRISILYDYENGLIEEYVNGVKLTGTTKLSALYHFRTYIQVYKGSGGVTYLDNFEISTLYESEEKTEINAVLKSGEQAGIEDIVKNTDAYVSGTLVNTQNTVKSFCIGAITYSDDVPAGVSFKEIKVNADSTRYIGKEDEIYIKPPDNGTKHEVRLFVWDSDMIAQCESKSIK